LVSESPCFMVEVVDSPTELPKCIGTQIKQRAGSSCSKEESRTIRFGKPEGPILSRLAAVRGIVNSGEGVLSSEKRRLMRENKIHDKLMELQRRLLDLMKEK
jgi:hypothetical protein